MIGLGWLGVGWVAVQDEVLRDVHPIAPWMTGCLLVAGLGGCGGRAIWPGAGEPEQVPEDVPALVDGHPMITESERPRELGDDAVVIQITFDVLRVDLPIQGVRHSRKIWNHIDETRANPRLTALLARNGFRIGTGTPEAWPALRVLFEANHARSLRTQHAVMSGAPLSMRLGELDPGEPLFLFQRDGRMVGRTFEGGTKFLHIDYALDPSNPLHTMAKVTPEVRRFSDRKRWERIDGRFREVPEYEGQVFSELGVEVSVGPGEFLLIGPSDTATLESVVGSRFLTGERNNVAYETVIFLTPQPMRLVRSGR